MIVPWTALWTGETEFSWRGICRYSFRQSVFRPMRQGMGTPIYVEFHPQRQRQAVAENRCHVCGEKIAGHRISMGIEEDGAVIDPLTCVRCSRESIRSCPHLQKQATSGELVIRDVQKSSWRPVMLEGSYDVVDAFEIMLERWERHDVAWLERVQ